MAGLKPWTRTECARLAEEARETLVEQGDFGSGAAQLIGRLKAEFAYEIGLLNGERNLTANIDSVYTRAVSISGPVLTDSYHFGQTISYDFGRPFERGTNLQAGGSFDAAAGPVALYVRTEFQHAPSAPALSDAARNIIALRDQIPLPPAVPTPLINRARFLDAYAAVNVDNWQLQVGKQSLSWGPGPGGPLLLSDNAQPVNMVRLVNPGPIRLPWFLGYLFGPVRLDQFIGRLAGRIDHPEPWIYGQKISFKPTPWLEIGYGRTTTIGGRGGDPFTIHNFILSYFGQVSSKLNSVPGSSDNEMDWTFYVPGVRNYIVLYGDLYAKDDFVAWLNPPRNPYRPGIYITHFPKIPKLDLHIEAANTQSPGGNHPNHGDQNYWNYEYTEADTNNGFLTGNTVGRMGQAYQGWLTYWLSGVDTLRLTYKNSSVDQAFITGGGMWQDYGLSCDIYLRSGFYLKAEAQYEHISHYPILFDGPQQNFTAILEVGFLPRKDGGTNRGQ
jgi:hypothetical protein